MKFRKDFVTNSSSSSYICDICGNEVSGWDYGLSDAEMVECENGHTFCTEHMLTPSKEDILSMIDEGLLNDFDNEFKRSDLNDDDRNFWFEQHLYDSDLAWAIPAKFCPVCQFETILPEDAKDYLMRKMSLTGEQLLAEWKKEFKDYAELRKYCRGEK